MSAKSTPNNPQTVSELPSSQKDVTKTLLSPYTMASIVDNNCCRITKIMLMPGESRVQEKHCFHYAVYVIQPAHLAFSTVDSGTPLCELEAMAGSCYNMSVTAEGCRCSCDCSCVQTLSGAEISLPLEYCVKNCGDTVYECIHIDMKQACN